MLSLTGLLLLLSAARLAYPLELELTTHLGNQQHFITGDEIKLLVSLDEAAYLLLLYQDASGNVSQLFPNAYVKNAYHKPGEYFSLPPQPQHFRFTVGPPYGSEWIWLFAANQPMPELPMKQQQTPPKQIALTMPEIQKLLSNYAEKHQFSLTHRSLKLMTSSVPRAN